MYGKSFRRGIVGVCGHLSPADPDHGCAPVSRLANEIMSWSGACCRPRPPLRSLQPPWHAIQDPGPLSRLSYPWRAVRHSLAATGVQQRARRQHSDTVARQPAQRGAVTTRLPKKQSHIGLGDDPAALVQRTTVLLPVTACRRLLFGLGTLDTRAHHSTMRHIVTAKTVVALCHACIMCHLALLVGTQSQPQMSRRRKRCRGSVGPPLPGKADARRTPLRASRGALF